MKMGKLVLTTFLILLGISKMAGQTAMNFNKTFGGNLIDDPIKTFNVQGKVFVFGNVFTPSTSGQNIGTAYGDNDYAMVVYDNAGNIIKKQCFGGSREDRLLNVALVDSTFHLIGYSYSDNGQGKNADGSILVNDNHPLYTYKYQEIYIVKIDFDGNVDDEVAYNLTDQIYINQQVGDWAGIGNINEQNLLVPYQYIQKINGADYYNGFYKFNMNILDTVRKRTDNVWRYTGPCNCQWQTSTPTQEYFTIDHYFIGGTANIDLSVREDLGIRTFDRYRSEDLYTSLGLASIGGGKVMGYNEVFCDSVPPCKSNQGGSNGVLCTSCCGWPDNSANGNHCGDIWAYNTYHPFAPIQYNPATFFPTNNNFPPYKAKFAKDEFILFSAYQAYDSPANVYYTVTYNNMLCPVKSVIQPPTSTTQKSYAVGTRVKDCTYYPQKDRFYSFTEFNYNNTAYNGNFLFFGPNARDLSLAPTTTLTNKADIWVTEHVPNNVNGYTSFSMIRQTSIRASDNIQLNNVSNVFDTNKVFICLSTAAGIGYNKTAPGKGSYDYWLVKFNLDKMAVVWDTTFGGQLDDFLKDADVNNGSVTLTGRSVSSYGGDKTDNSYGNGDMWTLNYCLPPKINFVANQVTGVQGDLINFTNYTINGFNYTWDFGDNAISYLQNPEHYFNNAGLHNVKLTASQGNCSNSLTKPNYINISAVIGVRELFNDKDMVLYPNPNPGVFSVSSNWEVIHIYNSLGKEVDYEIVNEKIALKETGIYVVELENKESKKNVKVKTVVYE